MGAYSFDSAFREAKKVGAQFELYGETYELPASLPVGAVLEVKRIQSADKDSEANIVELFDRVYGAAAALYSPVDRTPGYTDIKGEYHPGSLVQSWIDQGLLIDQMVHMLTWGFSQYGSQEAPTAAQMTPVKKTTPRGRKV